MYSYGSPHMAAQKQDDQLERTFSSYVRIQDVVLKTYLGRWTIGRSGERGSGISVLPPRYDDDDEGCKLDIRTQIRPKKWPSFEYHDNLMFLLFSILSFIHFFLCSRSVFLWWVVANVIYCGILVSGFEL